MLFLATWGLALTIAHSAEILTTSTLQFNIPSVSYDDLVVLDDTVTVQLTHDLVTVGAIQVKDIPQFKQAREGAFVGLANCLLSDENAVRVSMNDDSIRLTTAAGSSAEGTVSKMTSACGGPSSRLRNAIDAVSRQVFMALDKASGHSSQSVKGFVLTSEYDTFQSIHANGAHLEHLHSYVQKGAISSSEHIDKLMVNDIGSKQFTLPIHKDSGLFIAMTTGLYQDKDGNILPDIENGLFLQLPNGALVKAVSEANSLIFMIGEGGERWLNPVLGQPLKAVSHALVFHLDSSESNVYSRSWYGKMFLPPSDAFITHINMRFDAYRKAEERSIQEAIANKNKFVYELPTGCGSSSLAVDLSNGVGIETKSTKALPQSQSSNYLNANPLISNTLCGNDNNGVYCWTNCYTGAELPWCGLNAECIDPVTGDPVDGEEMCPSTDGMSACYLSCGDNKTDDFCYGVGTTMFMSGFTNVAFEDKGSTACVNLFFTEWTLDSKTKYVIGCLGIFVLGVFFEYLKVLKKQLLAIKYVVNSHRHVKDAISVLIYGMQLTISYFLMLAAMSYATELFCSMLVGLTVGYAFFGHKTSGSSASCHDTGGDDDGDVIGHEPMEDPEPSCCEAIDVENIAENDLQERLIAKKKHG